MIACDTPVAGQAPRRVPTLVTANVRELSRVAGRVREGESAPLPDG
ncbi:MAG: hypothetical protein AVDCRST_MAG49-3117 [uncultured Thermomicrobiales bacterium]|uniref:Uncharacterized protein n=1 Tax=uncultured Thermomicrobiales bacterium TaxID=1645740 RepID=A0A6J4V1W8_9BACT|nr:MAG: hypothetical protein AVDCRST_MAG49-3117 [uncultured Thermomicrobiales bacterium]